MLQEPRSAIDEYVASLGLAWIEDLSNTDPSLRRNAVRSEIMPLLESRFPGAAAALARYAELAAGDDEALELIAAEVLAGEVDPGGRLRSVVLGGRPLGMRRRIVRRWLSQATGSQEISADRIDAVLQLVDSRRGGRAIEAGGGWTVTLRQGMLSAKRQRSMGGRGT
jgi:tRNA(Ile)-lysidine synthase